MHKREKSTMLFCGARTGLKYAVRVSRLGPQSFRVFLGSSHVDVVARKLNDGGLLVQVRICRFYLGFMALSPLARHSTQHGRLQDGHQSGFC